MNENELIQAIAAIMDEALKSPAMSSEVSQGKIFEVISYSALLYETVSQGQNSQTLHKFINEVILPYVKARDKNNNDVYSICKIVLENWNKKE